MGFSVLGVSVLTTACRNYMMVFQSCFGKAYYAAITHVDDCIGAVLVRFCDTDELSALFSATHRSNKQVFRCVE